MPHQVIYFPIVICIAGLLIHVLASKVAPKELGRILFGVGLLVSLLTKW